MLSAFFKLKPGSPKSIFFFFFVFEIQNSWRQNGRSRTGVIIVGIQIYTDIHTIHTEKIMVENNFSPSFRHS